jgi:hypothetical protein
MWIRIRNVARNDRVDDYGVHTYLPQETQYNQIYGVKKLKRLPYLLYRYRYLPR